MFSFKPSLEKLDIKFNSLFNEMGELTLQTSVFNEKIKELTNDTESFSERVDFNINLETLTSTLSNIDSLKASFEKLTQIQTLNRELYKLINQSPALANYLAETEDITLGHGQAVRDVMKDEINQTLKKWK